MSRFKKSLPAAVAEVYDNHYNGGHVSRYDCQVLKAFFELADEHLIGKIPWTDVTVENAIKRVKEAT